MARTTFFLPFKSFGWLLSRISFQSLQSASTWIQVFLKEGWSCDHVTFQRSHLIFYFLPLAQIWICLAGTVWSLEQMERKHDSQWIHWWSPVRHVASVYSLELLGLPPSQCCLPANHALGINMRTSGNNGSHLVEQRAEWFLSQTRFPIVKQDFHSSDRRSSQICPRSRLISQ